MSSQPNSSYAQAVDAPPGFQFCLIGFPRVAHLVVAVKGHGTPGPTLCGIDRFQKPAIGWSMANRSSDGGGPAAICESCHNTRIWLERGAADVPIHACPPGDYARECAAAAHAFVRLVQINDNLSGPGVEKMTALMSEDELTLWNELTVAVNRFGSAELAEATRVG